jgi:hypothetical protein
MGGHAAWRKRVAEGEPAKGSGGAALRHRPRLGRKGADIQRFNRLGNIGGHGNPKRKKTRSRNNSNSATATSGTKNELEKIANQTQSTKQLPSSHCIVFVAIGATLLILYVPTLFYYSG